MSQTAGCKGGSTNSKRPELRRYHAPQLLAYGSLRELTASGSGAQQENPGGDVMQNPSDPGATYDGYKGPGYQARLTVTCDEENEAQLITAVLPQTAV